MSTLEELMCRPATLGEHAPRRPGALRPSYVPLILAVGAALVTAACWISPPIVASIEKSRAEAKQEAAKAAAAAAQEQRVAAAAARARADLERRAGQNGERVSAARAKAWSGIESVRALAADQGRPEIEREAARLALEARPVPADLPSSAALDLSPAIQADIETFAAKGEARAVNKALTDYQGGTQRVSEYLQQLEVERRSQFAELRRQPRAAAQAPAPVAAPAPSARLPAPRPAPEPAQPAKRQVTDW